MKAISLHQPWASLLATGQKRVETRGWPTSYRGPLLVHAAKKWDDELIDLSHREPFRSALGRIGAFTGGTGAPPDAGPLAEFVASHTCLSLSFGAIVGRVELVGCYPTEKVAVTRESEFHPVPMETAGQWAGDLEISRTEYAFGDYRANRFAWLCRNAVAFKEPIPFRGMQGLFSIEDKTVLEAAGVS